MVIWSWSMSKWARRAAQLPRQLQNFQISMRSRTRGAASSPPLAPVPFPSPTNPNSLACGSADASLRSYCPWGPRPLLVFLLYLLRVEAADLTSHCRIPEVPREISAMSTRNRTPLYRKYRDALRTVRVPAASSLPSAASSGGRAGQGIEMVNTSLLHPARSYAPLSTEDPSNSRSGDSAFLWFLLHSPSCIAYLPLFFLMRADSVICFVTIIWSLLTVSGIIHLVLARYF